MRICVCAYRDSAPLAPQTSEDVGGATDTPAHLAARSGRHVALPPVVMKHVLPRDQGLVD